MIFIRPAGKLALCCAVLPKKPEHRSCNKPASWPTRILRCWALTRTDFGSNCLRKGQRRRDTRGEEHHAHKQCDVQELWSLWRWKVCWALCCHPCLQAAAELRISFLGFRILVFVEVCGLGVLWFFSRGLIVTHRSHSRAGKKIHLLDSVLFKAAAHLPGVDSRSGMEWLLTLNVLQVNVLIAPILFCCWALESEGINWGRGLGCKTTLQCKEIKLITLLSTYVLSPYTVNSNSHCKFHSYGMMRYQSQRLLK